MPKRGSKKIIRKRNYCIRMDAEIRERVDKISAHSPFNTSRIIEECVMAYLHVIEHYVQQLENQKRRDWAGALFNTDRLEGQNQTTSSAAPCIEAFEAMIRNPIYVGAVIASAIRDLQNEQFKEDDR